MPQRDLLADVQLSGQLRNFGQLVWQQLSDNFPARSASDGNTYFTLNARRGQNADPLGPPVRF